jgi:hypothetical protein
VAQNGHNHERAAAAPRLNVAPLLLYLEAAPLISGRKNLSQTPVFNCEPAAAGMKPGVSGASGGCAARHFLVDLGRRPKLIVYLYRQMKSSAIHHRFARPAVKQLRGADSFVPFLLHAQIEKELQRMIALPEFKNGVLLPNELTLVNCFGVSSKMK